jgi:threonine aldolase
MSQQFASDNNAGLCPEALQALIEASGTGHAAAYGDDSSTTRARAAIRTLLEAPDAAVFFVFNGTAANALALAHVCRPYHAVIAHAVSHIATDEAGAPQMYSGGASLLTADDPEGKLSPASLERLAAGGRGVHHVKPRAVSLTEATEFGTVYKAVEIVALTSSARRLGLIVHMDGARLANAVASLDCAPADVTWRAGVDVLSLGGVKNGLGVGEAVVFFDPSAAAEFEWRVKQAGHLNSKMRLVTAPWAALLQSGAWLRNATHANAMARRLAAHIEEMPDNGRQMRPRLLHPVEANGVFVDMSPALQARLRAKGWRFYTFSGETGCRLMCAWDTSPETVDRFAADLAAAASHYD